MLNKRRKESYWTSQHPVSSVHISGLRFNFEKVQRVIKKSYIQFPLGENSSQQPSLFVWYQWQQMCLSTCICLTFYLGGLTWQSKGSQGYLQSPPKVKSIKAEKQKLIFLSFLFTYLLIFWHLMPLHAGYKCCCHKDCRECREIETTAVNFSKQSIF